MTELGNRLKEARVAKGMSLDDLQSVTKIQKRYLSGIEEGNYEMMPGKFYVRAFIKQYCEAVGLDSEEIFDQYKSDVPVVYNEELPDKLSRVQTKSTVKTEDSKLMASLPKILGVIFVILAAVLIYLLVSNYVSKSDNKTENETTNEEVNYDESKDSPLNDENKDEESAATEEVKEEPAAPTEEKPEPEEVKQELTSVSSSGKNSTYELKNAKEFKLKVTSIGETWVNIQNGSGKSIFQGTLKKDQVQEIDFTNETGAVIVIGNAAETEIFVNDEKLAYAISPAQSVTQNVTIQFTKAQ
ncbi:helix-turn-helix domain-containing protein [Bacillus sp. V59.32b]|nr:RodZ domain-containing protein [Bacillus sp. V59.32b]RFU67840.1 helix-turn-helix domain-containing protein [Bacillus sp. V59.32b]